MLKKLEFITIKKKIHFGEATAGEKGEEKKHPTLRGALENLPHQLSWQIIISSYLINNTDSTCYALGRD
jgi:hypothetical protein